MPVAEFAASLALDAGRSAAQKGISNGILALWRNGRKLSFLVWRRNGKARISISALICIRRTDGKFAVIQNRHRPEDYSAIGGCFKCDPIVGPSELEKYQFLPENRIIDDADIANDLRGYTKRRFIPAILKWKASATSACERSSECLCRECEEELSKEFAIAPSTFPWHKLRFRPLRSHMKVSHWQIDHENLTQVQLFEIYDLVDDDTSRELFGYLIDQSQNHVIWVTSNDIISGRCSKRNVPIGAPTELFIRSRISRPGMAPPNQSAGQIR